MFFPMAGLTMALFFSGGQIHTSRQQYMNIYTMMCRGGVDKIKILSTYSDQLLSLVAVEISLFLFPLVDQFQYMTPTGPGLNEDL